MWWQEYSQRAKKEVYELAQRYPTAQVSQTRLSSQYCPICQSRGKEEEHLAAFVHLRTPVDAKYSVVMVYSCDFPHRIPAVWPMEALRPQPPDHQYSGGRLCLTTNEHDPAVTGSIVMEWAHDWLTCYDVWRLTGTFPPRNYGRHRV